ncbi:putative cytochrome p450 51a [Echria macrotheca]|uniref:Cytochrome p450 51a n=1 Tax=Echria macrotheca TaxID=438768 RepID=A0AAJ0F6X0_9PEZI|nr:putative cytochrome p450 51a [Echria macrotheca]
MAGLEQSRLVQLLAVAKPTTAGEWAVALTAGLVLITAINVLRQFLPQDKSEPPLVFHWFPLIGSTVTYGKDPPRFLMQCREKYGDIFTFVMLGRKTTAYLGTTGNEFVLNAKVADLNAEEVYGPLCTPVFGRGVIYDCEGWRFMEQKRFMKAGFTNAALSSHVRLMEDEVLDYIKSEPSLKGNQGTLDVPPSMAQITIFTASRTLQGPEVRSKLSHEVAELYHDLDMAFQPINFIIPWAPLPRNRRRDIAQAKMRDVYLSIIKDRRQREASTDEDRSDMLWALMEAVYKDGAAISDVEIAHLMIALLMAGQHTASSTSSWIILRLASRPDIAEELYDEQVRNLGRDGALPRLEFAHLDKLPLLRAVVKETLRLHSSIHSIMRRVTRPMSVPGTDYIIPPGRTLLASPSVVQQDARYFPNPEEWDPHRWDSPSTDQHDDDEMVDYGFGAISKGTRSPYLPFGAGRHRCIGEHYAYANLMAIIATLVRHFRFGTMDGSRTVPPTDFTSMFSVPSRPAVVRWERREVE